MVSYDLVRRKNLVVDLLAPTRIVNKIEKVAYELKQPIKFALLYLMFHVFMQKKCIHDPSPIVPIENVR